MLQSNDAAPGTLDPALKPLFGEIGNLKRIRSAGRDGSIASRLFARAWGELVVGAPAADVAAEITAAALAAARLGDIDRRLLLTAGLSEGDADAVLRAAVGEFADVLGPEATERFAAATGVPERTAAPPPAFVHALSRQPRAGVTCPGRPRIMLEPPENHAEHCLVVAVLGVLLAPAYGADAGIVFLASLAHHFHNAGMPDSGFTGEMLLGDHLEPVMRHFTDTALAELPEPLRGQVVEARRVLPDADTPEGRAFNAADTIDRVMQIEQHLQAATLTMSRVLGEMELVHDGPVKGFQTRVLAEMGLAS
ncbi:hypothetical protein [Aureimonas leprariae]|uniref:HD domain-containing protein n=1 Tax=Plantimonas leprariae TaxID=2615207 RepID=A0A7V7U159_9HYPH|nr:hypothetical protein [Aureimonas leprariae]KAB0681422.1 hypothetical protein F6X38_05940 [Aureimonas leprariae]